MSIALLYERSEADEMGIRLTAEEMGIDLTYVPFRKIALSIGKKGYSAKTKGKDYTGSFRDIAVVLNRAQSKNRRLQASYIMELFDKKAINSSSIEFICYSKLRTLLHLWAEGIPIPKTVYVPCDATDTLRNGTKIHNEKDIAELLQNEIASEEGIVIKPDAGTHGKGTVLSANSEQLIANIQSTKSSIINPVGIVAQEFIQKWFYDLRIIVYKEKGKSPICHPTALARGSAKDFRTNAYLGNPVFDAKLPSNITELGVKCGNALSKDEDAWIFALDAMIDTGKQQILDASLESELKKAALAFGKAQKVKADESRLRDFRGWNSKLEESFKEYMDLEAYGNVKRAIEESIGENKDRVVFHESNSCPEFWENTRLIAGINLAVPLLESAQSLV